MSIWKKKFEERTAPKMRQLPNILLDDTDCLLYWIVKKNGEISEEEMKSFRRFPPYKASEVLIKKAVILAIYSIGTKRFIKWVLK